MKFSRLHIVGNVLDILEGKVEPELLSDISSMDFRFALGGATFSDRHAIGEALILDGTPCVSWEEMGKVHTACKKEAFTPFLMGIQKDQPEGIKLEWKKNVPTSLELFYGELAKKYPMGFAITGALLIPLFQGVYLQKAPIYHENINTHKELYWSSIQEVSNRIIRLFGVVIPQEGIELIPTETLERAFYQNPNDQGKAPFKSHTHAALINSSGNIEMVYHMLTTSCIDKGTFTLYPLTYD